MRDCDIALNRTYRLKPEIVKNCVQANGEPFTSPDITIVRVKAKPHRRTHWFYDAKGNAYRSSDFSMAVPTIQLEG